MVLQRLRDRNQTHGVRLETALFCRRDAIVNAGMPFRTGDLSFTRVRRDHTLEKGSETDRRLTVSGGAIPGEFSI